MNRRSRKTTTVRWAATALAAGLIAGGVASRWWFLQWRSSGGPFFSVEPGVVLIGSNSSGAPAPGQGGWHAGRARYSMSWWFWTHRGPTGWHLGVPIWLPLGLAAAGAGVLWQRELGVRKRERIGACSGCGYDRRGLATDAVCPECGTAAAGPNSTRGTA